MQQKVIIGLLALLALGGVGGLALVGIIVYVYA